MVTMVTVSQVRRLLGVVLRGVTMIIGVPLLLILFLIPSSVVVSLCGRVGWLIVGMVGVVRQSLDWGGGNI